MPIYALGQFQARPQVRNAAGTGWQQCIVRRRNGAGTGWDAVWNPLQASAPGVSRSIFLAEPAPPTSSVSGGTTVSVSNNVGAVTYSWARVSGSTAISISSATSASPSFTASVTKNSGGVNATWRCTVTDSVGQVRAFDISVFLDYNTNL